jgi:hypothetical protein
VACVVLHATSITGEEKFLNKRFDFNTPFPIDHSFSVLSAEEVATTDPSADQVVERIGPLCAFEAS